MAIENGDIIQVILDVVTGTGYHFQNKFTFEYAGAGLADATFLAGMDTWLEAYLEWQEDEMPSGITTFTGYVDKLAWDDTEKKWYVSDNVGVIDGTCTLLGTADTLPWQNAACLVAFTGKPKSRGRKFTFLYGEDTQVNSSWTSGTLTNLALTLAWYLAAYEISTNHYINPGVTSVKWETFLPFVSGLVSDIVFTQRRRTKGRGI